MTLSVRRLEPEDAEDARKLGMEAFGVPGNSPPSAANIEQHGMIWFGAFEGELLVGTVIDREYDSYFGGVPPADLRRRRCHGRGRTPRTRHPHAAVCQRSPKRETTRGIDLDLVSIGSADLSQVRLRGDR